MTEKTKSWLTIAGFAILLLVLALIRPLTLPDEGRYADIGRWMFISGDWLIPRMNGIPFFHKPPLLYWLLTGGFQVADVHVWTARWVPVAHAWLLLVAVYLAVRRIQGDATARKVSMVLGSSVGFLVGGQFISHDFLVATWISLAIGLFGVAFVQGDRPSAGLARLGFVACALGVMSKGLIGMALPGMVIFVWLVLTGQLRKLLDLPWVSGLLLFSAIAMPWMVQVQSEFPGFFDYYIIGQHFSRYSGNQFNGQQPWWFYPAVIGILMFPWVIFILVERVKTGLAWARSGRLPRWAADPWASLPWVWLGVIVLFFSIPASKLMGYILPVIVPVAMLAARSWDRLMTDAPSAGRWFVGVCLASVALAVGANFLARHNSLRDSSRDTAKVLACLVQPDDKVYVAGGYPYDLPFEAHLKRAVIVINDWDDARKNGGDDWRRVFFEGSDFDAPSGQVLQNLDALDAVSLQESRWLVVPADFDAHRKLSHWQLAFKGQSWWLWQSGPVPASLSRCVR